MSAQKPAVPQLRRDSSRNLLAARSASAENAITERYPNFFYIPHKAFRVMFFDVYEKIGNVNFKDDEDMLELQKLIDQAVYIYSTHNHEESNFYAKKLAERDSSLVEKWNEDHVEHGHTLKSFKDRIAQIVAEQDHDKRMKALATLYVDFGDYVAADLAHMNFEERKIMGSFWEHFTDEELHAIEMEFVKQIDPDFMQAIIGFVFRAHNIAGRIGVLKLLQASGTPEEHVRALLGLIAQHARPKEVEQIKAAVGFA